MSRPDPMYSYKCWDEEAGHDQGDAIITATTPKHAAAIFAHRAYFGRTPLYPGVTARTRIRVSRWGGQGEAPVVAYAIADLRGGE